MPPTDAAFTADRLRQTLACYDEPLLRAVATQLVKPRGRWPAEELIKRAAETLASPSALDRRLKELDAAGRRLLAAVGHSRQPRWPVGSLVELGTALGSEDALAPVLALLQAGLLLPDLGVSDAPPQVRL